MNKWLFYASNTTLSSQVSIKEQDILRNISDREVKEKIDTAVITVSVKYKITASSQRKLLD